MRKSISTNNTLHKLYTNYPQRAVAVVLNGLPFTGEFWHWYSCHEKESLAGGFEPSATGLSLFALAFYALQLSTRCLSLRALFCLNLLALLHRCYIERLWDMGVIVALLV